MATSALGLAACSSSPSHTATSGSRVRGGTVTTADVAEPPNYIFPLETDNVNTGPNTEMAGLLWKGLYQLSPVKPVLDYSKSIGNTPVFSNGGTVVTITMKHFKWSDGKPVSARDVEFAYELTRAIGPLWSGYVPGGFPANVKAFHVLGTYKFQIDLTHRFAATWFDDNQLTDLVPLPQQAWDKTSPSGAIGNYDLTTAGAKKVYRFLNSQSQQMSTFGTNPLWKVVDGAWTLSSFGGASSPTIFLPNKRYSGHRAIISKFEITPYTSSAAELNALLSGPSSLTYGTIPTTALPQVKRIDGEGYTSYKVFSYSINFFVINFTNPKLGKLFDQLYVRQALQHLVDQKTDIKAFQGGLGAPVYGPTPPYPANSPFLSSAEKTNPYPYSVSAAEQLLKAHGWAVKPGGTDVCRAGGPGAGHCGAGVPTGLPLVIPMTVASGSVALTNESRLFASDAAKAGVVLQLKMEPFNTAIAIMNPCTPKNKTSPTCTWGIGTYGGQGESPFPNSSMFFVPKGSDNTGGYDNPTLTALVKKIHFANSVANYHAVANFGATQLPYIWFPDPFQVSILVVNSRLHTLPGTTPFNAMFGNFTPEDWYFTKG